MDKNRLEGLDVEKVTAEDLGSLQPNTIKEHLMVLSLGVRGALTRLEGMEDIPERVARLEGAFKYGVGAVILVLLAALAKAILF